MRLFSVMLLLFLVGKVIGQEYGEVIYCDYTRLNADLLDSVKKSNCVFKGMVELKREAFRVKENTPVQLMPKRMEQRKLEPRQLIERRRISVLNVCKFLGMATRSETVMGWATAVVLSTDGVCVSNYHVFQEVLDSTVRLNPRDSILFVATEGGRVYPITEILSYNRVADVAFFKIDTRGDVLEPMPLGKDLPAGERVHLLSHPAGYPYAYTSGVVSRAVMDREVGPFSSRLEITADYAKGSSGGPIMDDRGNMVAMVSSIRSIYFIDNQPATKQMNVHITIPVSSLRRLMQGQKKNEIIE